MQKKKHDAPYGDFEQGPIRPPSETESLLIRITRNCPWNLCIYQVGRRLGILSRLEDMETPHLWREAENNCRELGVTPENVDVLINHLMKRFV